MRGTTVKTVPGLWFKPQHLTKGSAEAHVVDVLQTAGLTQQGISVSLKLQHQRGPHHHAVHRCPVPCDEALTVVRPGIQAQNMRHGESVRRERDRE